MKKITLLLALFLSFNLLAQVTNEGKPLSWKLADADKSILTKTLPSFDLASLQAEDIINDQSYDAPWRFGFEHDVDFGLEDGHWTVLKNGDRIWRIKFHSPNALSMNVIFDQFYMPEGGKMYLYNEDRTDLLGAYTTIQNQENGVLGTWLVKGDVLWIEYFEPALVANQGKLHIETIVHGYRGTGDYYDSEKGLNTSGDCNHDVDCPVGDDWDAYKEKNKKSVALLLLGGGLCTGALVNNTAGDSTPYILTANHCYSDPSSWSFRFNWISPDPVCGTTDDSTNETDVLTISGASLKAKNAATDFCLVEINEAVPEDWGRTYAGWDKTDENPTFEVGIHHPDGDIMKVCRDDTGAIKNVNSGAETWEITTAGGGWELGVTEPGSSGSPLFDQDGRVIGQLYGGGAACTGTDDNGLLDYYGRFGVSWNGGGTPDTSLLSWLDPLGTNPDVLDGFTAMETYGLDAAVSIALSEVNCGESSATPSVTLLNNGTTILTSATIVWSLNGGTNHTINWTGSLAQDADEVITLGEVSLVMGLNTINVSVSQPNEGEDENSSNNTATLNYTNNAVPTYPTSQVHLHLLTDNFAYETQWILRDASGTVIAISEAYQVSDSNTNFYYDIDVITGQCYSFEIIDDQSEDGICCNWGEGMYELTGDNYDVIASGGDFGAGETTDFAVSAATGVDEYLSNLINIFPNPTNGSLNIQLNTTHSNLTYSMLNIVGQKVREGNLNETTTTLSLTDLTNGVYVMKITDTENQKYMVEKIIIRK